MWLNERNGTIHVFNPARERHGSDEGFSVEVLGRTGLRYRENGKSLFMDSEVTLGPEGMVVHSSSIVNWENNGSKIDESEKKMIENIKNAFRFGGFEIFIAP